MSEVEVPRSNRAPIDARVFSKIGRKAGCKFVIVANPLTEALAKVILKYTVNTIMPLPSSDGKSRIIFVIKPFILGS